MTAQLQTSTQESVDCSVHLQAKIKKSPINVGEPSSQRGKGERKKGWKKKNNAILLIYFRDGTSIKNSLHFDTK